MSAATIVEKKYDDDDRYEQVQRLYCTLFFCGFVFHNNSLSMINLRNAGDRALGYVLFWLNRDPCYYYGRGYKGLPGRVWEC